MGIILAEDVQLVINSVDLSNHVDQIEIGITVADIDTTAMGSAAKTRIGGLQDNKLTVEFQQDFAAGSVQHTIWPLIGTIVAVTCNENSTTTAGTTTNPTYTFNVLIADWKPISGKVGELQKSSVSWPISGPVTQTPSP